MADSIEQPIDPTQWAVHILEDGRAEVSTTQRNGYRCWHIVTPTIGTDCYYPRLDSKAFAAAVVRVMADAKSRFIAR